MAEASYDLVVIGAGPGGYVAAIRAAQLGMKVACVERDGLGGTCLNWGCIPSKALLDSSELYHQATHDFAKHGLKASGVEFDLAAMMKRKDQVVGGSVKGIEFLLKKNKVDHVRGSALIASPAKVRVSGGDGERTLDARNIVIATGSKPVELPTMRFDGKQIISSDQAISLPGVPQRLVIIGAGVIGLELGSVWSRLGSKVLLIEFLDRIAPAMDREMTTALQKLLEKQGLEFKFGTSATGARIEGGKVVLDWAQDQTKGSETADVVLVAVGRKPNTDGLGLDAIGLTTDKRGFIPVDGHFRTSVPGLYAIGDVIGGLMLAHKAEEEGVAVAEIIAGQPGHVNYNAVPGVVYTNPELAGVGLTEEDAKEKGIRVKIGKFPFSALGRARALGSSDGIVKVIGDADTDRLLGVHILGPRASDLIGEAAVAIEFAASVEDLARSVHAHPTLSEAIKEAALAADKRAIHI